MYLNIYKKLAAKKQLNTCSHSMYLLFEKPEKNSHYANLQIYFSEQYLTKKPHKSYFYKRTKFCCATKKQQG